MRKATLPHSERKHSKFSASGAERWFECSGSVALSEGLQSKDNEWSLEGTKGHEVLEQTVKAALEMGANTICRPRFDKSVPHEMVGHATHAANHILKVYRALPFSELMIETRVLLDFIHPEAFGSLDYAVVDVFGTLHIMDYKYGKYLVSPEENLQFLFYALAVAYKYQWNFKRVRMWSLQPRAKNFDGNYSFWEITIEQLRKYVSEFRRAVDRVEKYPDRYKEGSYCFFCPAKGVCPLKQEGKREKTKNVFLAEPLD